MTSLSGGWRRFVSPCPACFGLGDFAAEGRWDTKQGSTRCGAGPGGSRGTNALSSLLASLPAGREKLLVELQDVIWGPGGPLVGGHMGEGPWCLSPTSCLPLIAGPADSGADGSGAGTCARTGPLISGQARGTALRLEVKLSRSPLRALPGCVEMSQGRAGGGMGLVVSWIGAQHPNTALSPA